MKILLSLLGVTLTATSGAALTTSVLINNKTHLSFNSNDMTPELQKVLNRLEEMSYNDPNSDAYTDEEITETIMLGLVGLKDIWNEDNFYKYYNVLNSLTNIYHNRLKNIMVGDKNLFDHSSEFIVQTQTFFTQKNEINKENDGLLTEYHEITNESSRIFKKLYNKSYSQINSQIATNDILILESQENIKELESKISNGNNRLDILSNILKVNGETRKFFDTFNEMFNEMDSYLQSSYDSALWHSDHYKKAWWPIYGIFFTINFKEAMTNLMNGMKEFAVLFTGDENEKINVALKDYERDNGGYIDEVIDISKDKEMAKDIMDEFNILNIIADEMQGPMKVVFIIAGTLSDYVVNKILDFAYAVALPILEAEKLHNEFESDNGISDSYKIINSEIENMREKLEVTNEEINAVNEKVSIDLSNLSSELKEWGTDLNIENNKLIELQKSNKKAAELKSKINELTLKNLNTMSFSNHILFNKKNNIISDQKSTHSANDFKNLLNEYKELSVKKEKTFNELTKQLISDDFIELNDDYSFHYNNILSNEKEFIDFFESF